jgi:hypothetical protein
MPGFFGLSPRNRQYIFQEIFELVYHGQGGFSHTEVYNMPIWMRKNYIQNIADFHKKQQAEIDQRQMQNHPDEQKIHKPNIKPQ